MSKPASRQASNFRLPTDACRLSRCSRDGYSLTGCALLCKNLLYRDTISNGQAKPADLSAQRREEVFPSPKAARGESPPGKRTGLLKEFRHEITGEKGRNNMTRSDWGRIRLCSINLFVMVLLLFAGVLLIPASPAQAGLPDAPPDLLQRTTAGHVLGFQPDS
ncbi:MAG: hypothetical protein WCZ10_14635, partial [Desulfobulbaceae bacterium]